MDQDLGGDTLKLVRYKILFVKREYEAAFPEQEDLLAAEMDGSVFTNWKIAEFLQSLQTEPGVALPAKWAARNYPGPEYVLHGKLRCIPEADRKYLRVYYEVADRYARELAAHNTSAADAEVDHWNEVENQARRGARQFWLNHPRIGHHFYRKAAIDGIPWTDWIVRELGGPAGHALELGCGSGAAGLSLIQQGIAARVTGVDLDAERFEASRLAAGGALDFIAADVNRLELEPETYDLVYALESLHHFESLEFIMAQACRALKPGGFIVLEEYVGPARFQWTDLQLSLTRTLLGLIPPQLRIYENGIEKVAEGRSTVEQVIAVCPSEAIRSNDIVGAFQRQFRILHHCRLGGTIQHLLYAGIVHNFPDGDPDTDRMIDSIDALETAMIDAGMLESDFVLLVGTTGQ